MRRVIVTTHLTMKVITEEVDVISHLGAKSTVGEVCEEEREL